MFSYLLFEGAVVTCGTAAFGLGLTDGTGVTEGGLFKLDTFGKFGFCSALFDCPAFAFCLDAAACSFALAAFSSFNNCTAVL